MSPTLDNCQVAPGIGGPGSRSRKPPFVVRHFRAAFDSPALMNKEVAFAASGPAKMTG